MAAPPILEAVALRKAWGDTVAVADLSFAVAEGEILALVGPDGAGKTTTLRLLLGLLRPDAGVARVAGVDPRRDPRAARRVVGHMPQAFALYGELTVLENLRFLAEARDLSRREWPARAERLLAATALAPFRDRLACDLSGGMRQKLALCGALLPGPRLLVLDEPTTAVDPAARRDFWELLYALAAEGITLVVTTPFLDEAERCGRIGFMLAGRLLALDTPERLVASVREEIVEVAAADRREARIFLAGWPGVRRVQAAGASLRLVAAPAGGAALAEAVAGGLSRAGLVATARPVRPTLADAFDALAETVA